MDKNEFKKFMKQYVALYPCFKTTTEGLEAMERNLKDLTLKQAEINLDKCIAITTFPPSVAQIKNPNAPVRRRQQEADTQSPAWHANGGIYETFVLPVRN